MALILFYKTPCEISIFRTRLFIFVNTPENRLLSNLLTIKILRGLQQVIKQNKEKQQLKSRQISL